MKIFFLFISLFIFLYSFSQKPRDTIGMDRYEKEAAQEDFKKCNELTNDFKGVSFQTLEQMISDEIIFASSKSNIVVNYHQPFSKHMTIIDIYDYTPVFCNYNNPAYNQSDSWNKKTIRYLHRKFSVNMIPYLPHKGEFVNKETVKSNVDKNDKTIKVFLNQKKSEISGHFNADDGEKYHFIPAKGFRESKLNLKDGSYQEFEINFRNYLGKIITVKYIYDEYKEVYKTYQYKLQKWIEIPTTDEYKF